MNRDGFKNDPDASEASLGGEDFKALNTGYRNLNIAHVNFAFSPQ
jgi:hypothetical protein